MTETQQPQQMPPPHDDEGEKLVLNSPEEAKTPRDFLLWAGVIALAVMTAFSPALHGRFLWDDDRHVEANRGLRDAAGLANIWTAHWQYFFTPADQRATVRVFTPQYYPVTHTTFWIEAQILAALDRPLAPTLFHVTNMILHAAGAILLWFILRALKVPGAWAAAAIWALHPVQAESVAWISERKNVLSGALFFGAIFMYLKALVSGGAQLRGFEDNPQSSALPLTVNNPAYWFSLALFALAVLSKTVACSMPAVMLLLIWWKRGRLEWRRDVVPLLPFFAFGLVLAMFTGWIETHFVRATGEEWERSIVQHILLAGNAIWFYAGKLIAPVKLTFLYPKWELSASNPLLWLGVIASVATPVVLFLLRQRIGRGPVVGWLIFCGVLVPALGFFNVYPMRYSYVADHFQYLASAGLIVLIVAGVVLALRRIAANSSIVHYVLAGLVLVVLTGLTIAQSSIYDSQLSLWSDTAKKNPDNPSVRHNHGLALAAAVGELAIDDQERIARMLDQAAGEFEAATALNPQHEKAWAAWGQVLLEKHDAKQAMEKFEKSLAINPQNVDALMGRGKALVQLKMWPEALTAYQQSLQAAVAQKPYIPTIKAATIYQMLGTIHDKLGNRQAAISALKEAVRISPGAPAIHYDFGTLLAKSGKATSQPATTQAGATQPATTQAAIAATQPTRPAPATPDQIAAAEQFAAAIRAAPDFIDARISLAELMLDVGNLQGARTQLIAAAHINAAYPRLMEVAKRFDAALKEAEAATRPATTQAATQPA